MNRRFEPSELPEAIAARGADAFLITIGETRPHVVSVAVEVIDDSSRSPSLRVGAGRTTPRNIARNPAVTLLWPAANPEGSWSLVVDGTARADEDGTTITITPIGGILHTTQPSSPDRRC